MELIHNDVFGPVLVPSLGGSLYYVTLYIISLGILGCISRKRIKGFKQIEGVQGSCGKPNRKEDKGV